MFLCVIKFNTEGGHERLPERPGVLDDFIDEMEGSGNIFIINKNIFWASTQH